MTERCLKSPQLQLVSHLPCLKCSHTTQGACLHFSDVWHQGTCRGGPVPACVSVPALPSLVIPVRAFSSTFPPFFCWFPAGFLPPQEEAPRAFPLDTNHALPASTSVCLSITVGLVSPATAPHRCVTFLSFFACLQGLKVQRVGRINSF